MKKLLVSIFITLFLSLTGFAQREITGRVVEIVDGKTVIVQVPAGNKITAELQYIEVPESEQPFYQTAKDHLSQILLNQKVAFKPQRLLQSKMIAQIFAGGIDVSQQMIRDGAAWYAANQREGQDVLQSEIYQKTEARAKAEKLGIWSIEDLKPAWQIRAERAAFEKQQQDFAAEKSKREAAEAAVTAVKAQKAVARANNFSSESKMWATGANEMKMPPNFSNVGGLMVGYNPQYKFGLVATPLLKLDVSDKENFKSLGIGIGYFYADSETKGRESFYLIGVESESNDLQFLQENNLVVVADKQKINVGKAKYINHQNAVSVRESLIYYVQPKVLKSIAEAKSVEVRVGKHTEKVSFEIQTMLQNLIKAAE